ncbi:MAG: P1 family peptidase, partial [Gammaproteobacteria bacterium]|nr:P1 family peptidase [Gammaproteobacteria bacterium]
MNCNQLPRPLRSRLLALGVAALTFGLAGTAGAQCIRESDHVRARQLGIAPGILAPGPLNAITDVAGVLVGHTTLIAGDTVRTGATAILAHGGNLYQSKVPAAVFVFNGYGKSAGLSQVAELGEIESPIVLTN